MLLLYIFIGLGGACGAMARVAMANMLPAALFGIPCQILWINVCGCLMMGLLTEILAFYGHTSDTLRYFLIPGFLGGFTTFSAFALEFGLLFEKHAYVMGITYAALSVVLSITCFLGGMKLVRFFI